VVIGHNQDIAWGMTNSGVDVTDLYLEKLSGDGYLYDGDTKAFKSREETIKVAGGKSKTIVVRQTRDGMPLLSDRDDELVKVGKKATVDTAAPDRGDGYGVALRWTALDPGTTMDAVFALDKASDWSEFRSASALFDVPSQNLIYADKNNIGYTLPGKIPTRAQKDDGSIPAPGWDSDYKWTGYIPKDALPYEYNPKRGYIVTANQAVIDPDKYPYTLTTDWGYGTRSQRITDLIESKIKGGGKVSTDDMRQMQLDNSSEIAKLLVPALLKIDVGDRTSARPRNCWRAGTTPRTPTRPRPPTSTRSGATSSSSPSATSCPRSCGSRASACGSTRPTPPGPRTTCRRCASAASGPPTRRSRTAATAGSRSCASS
jgi:penicillin amidase